MYVGEWEMRGSEVLFSRDQLQEVITLQECPQVSGEGKPTPALLLSCFESHSSFNRSAKSPPIHHYKEGKTPFLTQISASPSLLSPKGYTLWFFFHWSVLPPLESLHTASSTKFYSLDNVWKTPLSHGVMGLQVFPAPARPQ